MKQNKTKTKLNQTKPWTESNQTPNYTKTKPRIKYSQTPNLQNTKPKANQTSKQNKPRTKDKPKPNLNLNQTKVIKNKHDFGEQNGFKKVNVGLCVYLPHAGFFPVHHSHVVDFVLLDASLLCLIQLLWDKAHEGIVWCVGWMCRSVCMCVGSEGRRVRRQGKRQYTKTEGGKEGV